MDNRNDKRAFAVDTLPCFDFELFDLLPDAIAIFDTSGGLQHFNQKFHFIFAQRLQFNKQQLSCQQLDNLLRESGKANIQLPHINYIKHPSTSEQTDTLKHLIFWQLMDNEKVFERTLVFATAKQSFGGIMIFKDITQSHNIDQMKTDFLRTTAHELRSPMANLFGYTELMMKSRFESVKLEQMLSIIHNETARMLNILNDLLALTKIETLGKQALKFQPHFLSKFVQQVISEQAQLLSQHQVTTRFLKEITVVFDADKLKQVLINLFSNAIKYSSIGSKITIELSHASHKQKSGVLLQISDEGIGMSVSQLSNIFKRFYRGNQDISTQGSGLGMSIVKEIVDLHQGEIQINSRIGEGTTVNIWLPQEQHLNDYQLPVEH